MATRTPASSGRKARTATARQAVERARRQERHQRQMIIGVGFGMVAALAAAIGVMIGLNPPGGGGTGAGIPSPPRVTAQGRTTPPPWPAPADPAAAVRAAGLPMLGSEGAVEHIHAHLDVLVDGAPVAVPAEIGADGPNHQISPLHTHGPGGVVHIESPVKADFSLGQFFTQWQVSLAADHLGGLRAGDGKLLRAYVNGTPFDGDPAAIIFHAHDEIALVYGTADQHTDPPASYRFPSGE